MILAGAGIELLERQGLVEINHLSFRAFGNRLSLVLRLVTDGAAANTFIMLILLIVVSCSNRLLLAWVWIMAVFLAKANIPVEFRIGGLSHSFVVAQGSASMITGVSTHNSSYIEIG